MLRRTLSSRNVAIIAPYLWLLLFFLAPFLIVLKISFAEIRIAIPPYTALLQFADGVFVGFQASIENYLLLIEDSLYWKSYLSSLKIGAISTLLTLLIGYPIAYAMARAPTNWRLTLLMLVILPFWTSFLIRVYAWIAILKNEGFINHLLLWTGMIEQPIVMLHTDFAVYVGIVYSYLPFMILPLYANLAKMDHSLSEAAADLGCPPLKVFWTITLPLSRAGIIAGCFLVFIPAVGEFVIPDLLGGSSNLMIGKTLWAEFFNNRDWPLASAAAVVLLLILVPPIMLFQRYQSRQAWRVG
jgi:putrescine transport system permease protein